MTKPHLLLDVDGPLNPYAGGRNKPKGYVLHNMRPTGWESESLPALKVWLNPDHGKQLKKLGYNIIWATTWAKDANKWISPHVGLPDDLETITWGTHELEGLKKPFSKLYWKTPEILTYMQKNHPGEPFVWVDDEAFKRDEKFLEDGLDCEVKVLTINPAKGLDEDDFEKLAEWKNKLDG